MRILALELGSWSVKGVEFESGFRRFEILDLHEVRLPLRLSDPVELYKQAITDLFAKLPSNPDKVVLSLPASNISLRFLTIPVKQRKKAEQMYRFELEDSLPFKLDDTVVEHVIYSQKDSSLVFAAIAPNRFIIQHLDYLKKIGLDPDWLTFEGMGLINLYLGSLIKTPSEISGPTLLLDMGHTKTNLSIVNDSRVEVFRSFSWGGFAITQNIALTTGLPLEDSEFQKHQMVLGGTPNEKTNLELSTTTLQAIGPLLTEINHSLIAYRNATKQSITSIQLSGGTALLKGL
ncbi:MAG: pilus assembly protein PilM, partial [Deltaproteobacteria bacterium]|nr:pilus assembly protein PilM [Deltaproteobacteria bacterium]